jgi:hypothetical protein
MNAEDTALLMASAYCAQKIVTQALTLIKNPEKKGAYLCVADSRGKTLLVVMIGYVPGHKRELYSKGAIGKAERLGDNPDHVSSWQTRDGKDKFGGAIRAEHMIYSFSGLPEAWDEACAVALVSHSFPGLLHPDKIHKIEENSQNSAVQDLLKSFD